MFNAQPFYEIEQFCADLYQGRRITLVPYTYPISFSVIAAGATGTVTQKINGNADFIVVDFTMPDLAGFEYFLQVTDSASQETLFNSPAVLMTVARPSTSDAVDLSIGMFKRLAANSNQVFTLQNNDAGASAAFTLLMNGVQVFAY